MKEDKDERKCKYNIKWDAHVTAEDIWSRIGEVTIPFLFIYLFIFKFHTFGLECNFF
jgi:hypothetical protein